MKTRCTDCCYPELKDSKACVCCEGTGAVTPLSTANRPGLSKLRYRIGTHPDFLETMTAMLSDADYPAMSGLKTRDSADTSLAMIDAWATVADVLTFYQERIANEGYLRTATERRSILELARLVGYRLRPGVASSVFLAYTIDNNTPEETTIPAGSRVQSIPAPGELPQSFETSDDLKARAAWNNLKPRMAQPQIYSNITNQHHVWLKGITTNLKPNDPLLIEKGDGTSPEFFRVTELKTDAVADRTLVKFRAPESSSTSNGTDGAHIDAVQLMKALMLSPSLQPRNTLRLDRKLADQFSLTSSLKKGPPSTVTGDILALSADITPSLPAAGAAFRSSASFSFLLKEKLTIATSSAKVSSENTVKVYAMRVDASLFGHNAPREPQYEPATVVNKEFIVPNPNAGNLKPQPWDEWKTDSSESETVLYLDRKYEQILPGSYVVIHKSTDDCKVNTVEKINTVSRSAYGISGETTKIAMKDSWWTPEKEQDISQIRTTKVYAQPEALELAEEPIEESICGGFDDPLELDGFYDGLESGRWVVVSGERTINNTSGVRFSELAMLSSVEHNYRNDLPGDTIHTFITLANKLAYCFKRDTVTIYGNVVKATHGETRKEVLGSGDGSKALQSFELKQFPLTFVAASNPTGTDSTLKILVNDILWHETDSLATLEANDHNFITKTNDDDKTTVTFGNGRQGARLPTGIENIKAEYRNGIGKPGNVKAEQISLVITKPLGVKEVINPLRASGGADREGRDSARKNAPLAVKALDRLVSVQDYEDFSRVYAGIGKACAVEISDGRRQIVHVTIAGADDIPIDTSSDLFLNLRKALSDFGDPFQPIMLEVRELLLVVISAKVKLLADYQWEPVVTEIRARLLEAFGFERREPGQDVLLSEVISVMHSVRGVAYVDVDTFGGIPEKLVEKDDETAIVNRRLLTPSEISGRVQSLIDQSMKSRKPEPRLRVNLADFEEKVIRPAQLAILTPDVPETLILNIIE